MEYYIAIIQKEILPLLTAWMDFEDITLSEKKKKRERERENRLVVARREWGELGK